MKPHQPTFIPAKKTTYISVFYWVLASLFYIYEMVLRASTGIFAHDLREAFCLNAEQLGFFSSLYYWAYTPLQIPCGLILDRFGARRILTLSCFVCAFGALVLGYTHSLIVASVMRWSIGAGSACSFIGCLALIAGWFDPKHFAFMTGMTSLMGCIGGMIAGKPLAWLSEAFGWRASLSLLGVMGMVLSVVIWMTIRDAQARSDTPRSPQQDPFVTSLLMILREKQVWLSGIIAGLLYLPVSAFAELWAVPFLQATYGIDRGQAAYVPMALYCGMGIGSPMMAVIAAQLNSYKQTLQWGTIVSGLLFLGIVFAPYIPFFGMIVLSGVLGMVLGSQVLTFSVSKESMPHAMGGATAGMTNGICMFFALLFQPLLGMLLDHQWIIQAGKDVNGVREYTAEMYRYAMFSFPLCFILSFILLKCLRESYSHRKHLK
jgi:MFS family permease